jgi:hypothetical protein
MMLFVVLSLLLFLGSFTAYAQTPTSTVTPTNPNSWVQFRYNSDGSVHEMFSVFVGASLRDFPLLVLTTS